MYFTVKVLFLYKQDSKFLCLQITLGEIVLIINYVEMWHIASMQNQLIKVKYV